MLEIARRRVPEAAYVEASVLDAELPACAAVVAAGEDSDERSTARACSRATPCSPICARGFTAEAIAGYGDGTPFRPGVVGYAARA